MLVAAISLGWNIYRDVIIKPKLRISVRVGKVVRERPEQNLDRVIVSITNFGPGKTRAEMLRLQVFSWWPRVLLRQKRYGVVIFDYRDPLSGQLPAKLDVGDKVDLTFRFADDLFLLNEEFTRVGIADPFGRVHWCARSEYRRAQKEYREQFGSDGRVNELKNSR